MVSAIVFMMPAPHSLSSSWRASHFCSVLHPHHHSLPLFFLVGCAGFQQVCHLSNRLVQLWGLLCLLSYHPLHAAPPVTGGRQGFAHPSPFSVLFALHRVEYGYTRSLRSDGCRCCHHLHRHIQGRVAPPVCHLCQVQDTALAPSEFGHHICEGSRFVLVVTCSLVDASCESCFLPNLYTNPLRCMDSCARPPLAVQKMLGSVFQGQFNVRSRMPLSVF
jgi:hypothetical protein